MDDTTELEREYINATAAARLVGLNRPNFYKWSKRDGFPSSIKLGGVRLFRRADLERWKRERG